MFIFLIDFFNIASLFATGYQLFIWTDVVIPSRSEKMIITQIKNTKLPNNISDISNASSVLASHWSITFSSEKGDFDQLTESHWFQEEFEDTKGVIKIGKSKKNRQHYGQMKKDKRTNNDN
jgi:hypothetical protein